MRTNSKFILEENKPSIIFSYKNSLVLNDVSK